MQALDDAVADAEPSPAGAGAPALAASAPEVVAAAPAGDRNALRRRLEALTAQAHVMLFMKVGTAATPSCAASLLRSILHFNLCNMYLHQFSPDTHTISQIIKRV